MPKYYAVKQGRSVGIFTTWPECQANVNGYSGAIYKSFQTLHEAQEFLSGSGSGSVNQNTNETGNFVYTDGSCINQKGGYGIVVVQNGKEIAQYKGSVPYDPCTNNKAELYAILLTLYNIPGDYIIKTDSQYSLNCVSGPRWIDKWKNNGWLTASGNPVENRDLIESIDRLLTGRNVKFEHVYGHKGNTFNELADRLADSGRENK